MSNSVGAFHADLNKAKLATLSQEPLSRQEVCPWFECKSGDPGRVVFQADRGSLQAVSPDQLVDTTGASYKGMHPIRPCSTVQAAERTYHPRFNTNLKGFSSRLVSEVALLVLDPRFDYSATP
ncbi:MAG: hypothetical protein QOE55_1039 [Acidobacteriaceae bacterium]|nr:hypothetical protein [Acidobacteriaceae bacterium]